MAQHGGNPEGPQGSSLRKNILANFLGKGWTSVLALVLTPVYLHFIGVESYGLVGFYTTLQLTLNALDLGLSMVVSREFARLQASAAQPSESRNLLRSCEWLYWPAGALIAVSIAVGSGPISQSWLKGAVGAPGEVAHAVVLMGLSIGMQWPALLYAGVLSGLQRQVPLNGILATANTIRWAGAALALWLVSPSVEVFLWCQIGASLVQTLGLAAAAWWFMPHGPAARFDADWVRRLWRFVVGVAGVTVMGAVLSQLDKILLSTLLPLEQFGYYTLAVMVASVLTLLATPVFAAVYPRLSEVAARSDEHGMAQTYHRASQLVSAVVLPSALALVLFSGEILLVWTGKPAIAAAAGPLLAVYACGSAINALLSIPYAAQLAMGITRLALLTNAVALLLLGPGIVALTHWLGALGGALAWLILNVGYLTIPIPVMHRLILRGELAAWYRDDIGRPLLAASSIAVISRLLLPSGASHVWLILLVGASVALGSLVAILAGRYTRQFMFDALRRPGKT